MKGIIEFEMEAREFGILDAVEDVHVLIAIDNEEKKAWFVVYEPFHAEAWARNPANYPSEEVDYEEALELYEQYKEIKEE